MAWTASKIFTSYLYQIITNTSASAWPTDALFECALFDSTLTPNQTDTVAHNAYAAAGGQWAAGGVVDTGSSAPLGWPALGRPLVTAALSAATVNPLTFSAVNTASANAVTTLTNANGLLLYDHSAGTPTDMGLCYIWFGGAQTVTLGTFTIAWNASGIMTLTL